MITKPILLYDTIKIGTRICKDICKVENIRYQNCFYTCRVILLLDLDLFDDFRVVFY